MSVKKFETGFENNDDPDIEVDVDDGVYLTCGMAGPGETNNVGTTFEIWTEITAWVDEQRGIARGETVEVAVAPYVSRIKELEGDSAAAIWDERKLVGAWLRRVAARRLPGHDLRTAALAIEHGEHVK